MHEKSHIDTIQCWLSTVYAWTQVQEGGAAGGSRVAEIATKVKEGTATQEERESYERVITMLHATLPFL